MKKKNGFTLIELLAVIVILAIIALIATPIILNMINNARKSAAVDSAYGYIEALETNNALAAMTPEKYTVIEDGTDIDVSTITVAIKGSKPESGKLTITKGKVVSGEICYNGYKVVYGNEKAEVNESCNSSSSDTPSTPSESTPVTYTAYNPGQTVKFDPVSNNKCSSGDTCYTWRVITVGDTTSNSKITLQMDHNLINKVAWILKADYDDNDDSYDDGGNTKKGPITALQKLEEATSGWDDALKLTYTYDASAVTNSYGTLSCTNGACTVAGNTITSNLKARMITGEEVRALTMNAGAASETLADNWTLAHTLNDNYYFSNSGYTLGTNTSGDGDISKLSWLVENTKDDENSGATANSYGDSVWGYWTLSPVFNPYGASRRAWRVYANGSFSNQLVGNKVDHGIRPVIEIDKSKLQ